MNKSVLAPCVVEKYKKFVSSIKKEKGCAMIALHEAQNTFGYIPMEICELISKELKEPMSTLSGIITFYSRFTLEPPGKIRISVCLGTACFVKGATKIFEKIKKDLEIGEDGLSPDGKFSLSTARCFGCCALAPVITVDDKNYGNMTEEKVDKLLCELKERSVK
ncbi:MAG: NAD(P)H-dependent oxidoreductase subunit E [Clostridia bacterium]